MKNDNLKAALATFGCILGVIGFIYLAIFDIKWIVLLLAVILACCMLFLILSFIRDVYLNFLQYFKEKPRRS